jgi:hypothetical protein
MSSQVCYRGGDCKPRLFKTHASYPIEEGDLCFVHPADGTLRPASAMANQGSESLNQDAFQQYFAGVALNKNGLQSGETSFRLTTDMGYCLVATAGDFEFDCPSTQWKPGNLVGVFATTLVCSNQKVDTAASASFAIGQAVPGLSGLGNAMTRVVVSIISTIMNPMGVQNQVTGSGSGQ